MKIVVIDGQGGRMGKLIVEGIIAANIECDLLAIGTNSTATQAMMKAGATQGATGENPVIVACRDADVIIGPIGIVSADALFGEVTPNMAVAIGQSKAIRILLPVNHCNNQVVGVRAMGMTDLIKATIDKLKEVIA